MSVMSRTKAREIALHLIFEMGFQQFEEENLNERLDEEIMKSISGDIALYHFVMTFRITLCQNRTGSLFTVCIIDDHVVFL